MTKKPLLFRMDSGNDALENMLLLHWNDPQLKFLIKHNFRREDRCAIAEELKTVCKNVKHPRDGKTVYIGSTWRDFETKKTGNLRFVWCMRSLKEQQLLMVRKCCFLKQK